MTPVVRRCPDGHYHRVIYDLAAFIADYPEQVMLAGIVQNWCAKSVHSIFLAFSQINVISLDALHHPKISMIAPLNAVPVNILTFWSRALRPPNYGISMVLMTTLWYVVSCRIVLS
jgi:hypothetical protein